MDNNTPFIPPQIEPKPKKPIAKSTPRDNIFAILFTVASIFMVVCGFYEGFGLGFTLSYLVIFTLTVIYLWKSDLQFNFYSTICGILSVIASFVYTLYDDKLMNVVLFFVIIGLFSIFVSGVCRTNKYKSGSYLSILDMFNNIVINPFKYFKEPFRSLKEQQKEKGKNSKFTKIIIGFVIAIPLMIVVLPLLSKSDVAFENLINELFNNIGEISLKIIIGLIFAPFIFSFVFAQNKRIGRLRKEKKKIKSKNVKKVDSVTTNTVLSSLSVFYIVYLFSQLAYFFNAFAGILPDGYKFTTATYARRGFFEMTIIVAINIFVVGVSGVLTKAKNNQLSLYTKALCTFVNIFSLILICTAFSKMYMYIDLYGLSRKRVLTTIAMVILTIIIICISIRIFSFKFKYMEYIIVLCTIFGLGVAYADIDTQIAKYNYNAYMSGKLESIDMYSMNILSESAVPYMVKLAHNNDTKISKRAKYFLMNKNYINKGFFEFNYSTKKAQRLLEDNSKMIDEYRKESEQMHNNDKINVSSYIYRYYSDSYSDVDNTYPVDGFEFSCDVSDNYNSSSISTIAGDTDKISYVEVYDDMMQVHLNEYIDAGRYLFGSIQIEFINGSTDYKQFYDGVEITEDGVNTIIIFRFDRKYLENEIKNIYVSYGKVD